MKQEHHLHISLYNKNPFHIIQLDIIYIRLKNIFNNKDHKNIHNYNNHQTLDYYHHHNILSLQLYYHHKSTNIIRQLISSQRNRTSYKFYLHILNIPVNIIFNIYNIHHMERNYHHHRLLMNLWLYHRHKNLHKHLWNILLNNYPKYKPSYTYQFYKLLLFNNNCIRLWKYIHLLSLLYIYQNNLNILNE